MMVVYGLFRFGPIEWHFTLVKDTFWNVVVMGVGRFFLVMPFWWHFTWSIIMSTQGLKFSGTDMGRSLLLVAASPDREFYGLVPCYWKACQVVTREGLVALLF